MQNDRQKQKLIAIVVIVGALVLLGVWAAYISALHSRMGKIVVQSAPSDLKLTFDGHAVNNNGTVYVSPGTHAWKATRAHFTSQTGSFTAKKGVSQNLFVTIQASDATGNKYLQDHPEEGLKIEGLTGSATDQAAKQAVDEQPLIKQLPFTGPGFEFRVDYGVTPDGAKFPSQPGIYISSNTDQGKQDALDWITSQGFDTAQMNITYQPLSDSGAGSANTTPPSGGSGETE